MRVLAALIACLIVAPADALAAFARLEAPLAYTARIEINGGIMKDFFAWGKGIFLS